MTETRFRLTPDEKQILLNALAEFATDTFYPAAERVEAQILQMRLLHGYRRNNKHFDMMRRKAK